jgi:hypothetical protein
VLIVKVTCSTMLSSVYIDDNIYPCCAYVFTVVYICIILVCFDVQVSDH